VSKKYCCVGEALVRIKESDTCPLTSCYEFQ